MLRQFIKNDLSPLFNLALPLVLTGLVQASLGFFNTIFLAHLGEEALAAGGLVTWMFVTLIVILFGTFGSVNILIAHKHGSKDQTGIVLVLRDGLILAALLAIPTFLLFWKISPILTYLGQSTQVATLARAYLHALAWGLFPKFIIIILFELVLGLGHSRTLMIFTIVTMPIYILFCFILIFGKWGLPALGVAGAGWGNTAADWIIASALLFLLYHSKHYGFYIRSIFTKSKPFYLWELMHLGLPMGLMYCLEVGFLFAISLMMGTLGVQILAANQITMQYLGVFVGVIFSITQAITVRMGHQLGAGKINYAKRTAYTGVFLSVAYMLLVALNYWALPEWLISVDLDMHNPANNQIIHTTSTFLFIAAFFQILESARISLFGALRALKDTRFTLLTSIIGFWLIPLPFGYWLGFSFGLGGAGLWWAMVMGACFSVTSLYLRFRWIIGRLERVSTARKPP